MNCAVASQPVEFGPVLHPHQLSLAVIFPAPDPEEEFGSPPVIPLPLLVIFPEMRLKPICRLLLVPSKSLSKAIAPPVVPVLALKLEPVTVVVEPGALM